MRLVASRNPTLLISLVLVVVAAAVGGVVFFTSSKAGGVDLTSAKLVPADASVYVGLNTNLASSQWVSAFDLAKRLGQENPEQALRDAAESDGDVNWEADIVPFLGGDASIWATGNFGDAVSGDTSAVSGGVIFKANDPQKALDVLKSKSQTTFTDANYNGISYSVSDDGEGYAAVIGPHLVVTYDEAAMKAVIDVSQGKAPSLGDSADFKQLKDDLTDNFLGFEYVDLQKIVDKSLINDPAVQKILAQAGGQNAALRPIAGAITANDAGFAIEGASRADAATNPGAAPRASKFVKLVPANTLFFVSTAGVAQAWQESMSADARQQLDDQLSSQGSPIKVEDLLDGAAKQLGVSSLDDVFGLLNGETSVAIWQAADGGTEGVLIADVSDDAKAKSVLSNLVAKGKPTHAEAINAQEIIIATSSSGGENAAYAVNHGVMVVGSESAVRGVLSGAGDHLGNAPVYTHTVSGLSTSLGTFMFVNLQEALKTSLGESTLTVPAATDALEGAMLNFVNENGLARISGVVSVHK